MLGNILAVIVIPFVGDLSDRIGRRPPIIVGALGVGAAVVRLSLRDQHQNVPLAILFSLLMWGVVYQGYNAVFPSFYPELFPTRTRVSAMAISQNIGTTITALLPALFAIGRASRLGEYSADRRRDRLRGDHHFRPRGLQRARNLPRPPERSRQARRGAGREGAI